MLAFASAKRLFNLRLQHKSATVRDSVAHKSEEWLRYEQTSYIDYRSEWFAIGICSVEQHCQLHCLQICNYNCCVTLSQRLTRFYRWNLFFGCNTVILKIHSKSIDGGTMPWLDLMFVYDSIRFLNETGQTRIVRISLCRRCVPQKSGKSILW